MLEVEEWEESNCTNIFVMSRNEYSRNLEVEGGDTSIGRNRTERANKLPTFTLPISLSLGSLSVVLRKAAMSGSERTSSMVGTSLSIYGVVSAY